MLRAFLLCILSLNVWADDFPVFPDAVEFERSRVQEQRFDLAVGGMQKKNGVWQPEKSERVAVDGERITFEVGRGIDAGEVYAFYQTSLASNALRQLFSCEALDCGSSAQWANGYFGVRELYGLDHSQRLSVWLLEGDPQQVVTLYVVQRGNKRVYAHLDVLNLAAPIVESIGAVRLLHDVFTPESLQTDELREIAAVIRSAQADGRRVLLVGHSYSAEDQVTNVDIGVASAQALKQRLAMLGIKNLQVDSVGMLAPICGADTDRIAVISLP